VTQENGNGGLVYAWDSGALSEALSDIWGAAISHYNAGSPPATTANMWKIGEEITSGTYTGTNLAWDQLRNMADPKDPTNKDKSPNTFYGQFFICATPTGFTAPPMVFNVGCTCIPADVNDNCGVHFNSGVVNYWFYLVSEGGSGADDFGETYNIPVPPATCIQNAGRIAYGAMQRVGGTQGIYNFALQTILVSIEEFGACSDITDRVIDAWQAVNIDYLDIQNNVIVNTVLPSGTSGSITFSAKVKITGSSAIQAPGADVFFRAGEEVLLSPGFHAEEGRDFLATIEPCSILKSLGYSKNNSEEVEIIDASNSKDEVVTDNKTDVRVKVMVYPNPYNDKINIYVDKAGIDEQVGVYMYDISGQLVYSSYSHHTNETININASSFAGMCVLKVVHQSGVENFKIVRSK
ncbi:MAG: M4 family metallopeptidase, partial [Bacteroidetes bacterium]|nr:M4 family metallopeptidase [Bacteroidota bacterium]